MKLNNLIEAKYFQDVGTIFNELMKDPAKRGLYNNFIGRMDAGLRTYEEEVDLFDTVAKRYETNFTTKQKEVFLRVLKKNAPKSAL